MYVGDRDINDVFCQACGHIAGREKLNRRVMRGLRTLSKIAETNDSFRRAAMKGIKSTDGKAVRTQGVAALGSLTNLFLQAQIAAFDAFTETNDPHGEHDFGSIQLDGCPKCSGKSTTTRMPRWTMEQRINSTLTAFWSLCSQTSINNKGEVTKPRLHFTKEKDSDTDEIYRKDTRSCDLLRFRFTRHQRYRSGFGCRYPDDPTLGER